MSHPPRCTVFVTTLALALVATGCADDRAPTTTLDRIVEALGGRDALTAAKTWRLTGHVTTHDPGQAPDPEAPASAATPSYTFATTDDVAGDRTRVELADAPGVPFFLPFSYAAAYGEGGGVFDGPYDLVTTATHQAQTAMRDDRVAALRKLDRLTRPERLVLRALDEPALVTEEPDELLDGRLHKVIAIADAPRPIRLVVDAESYLPAKAATLEDDPVLGDVLVEATFGAWSEHARVRQPASVTLAINGAPIGEERRDEVKANVALDGVDLGVPSSAPADAGHGAADGELRAALYHRYLVIGLDLQGAPGPASRVTLTDVAPGVVYVKGQRHHSLAIDTPDGIVVVEAPLDETRSLAVIDALAVRFPGKRISHVIATHHHHDHTGGIRTYVAKGATVVAGAETESYFRALAAAPHTIAPDLLATSPRPLQLAGVGPGGLELGGGAVRVMPVACAHARGMVIVYVPGARLVFSSDMYVPGFGDGAYTNPPAPKLIADGTRELYDAITAAGLAVDMLLDGGHGGGAVATLDQLRRNAGR